MTASRRQIAEAVLDMLSKYSSKRVAEELASYLVSERRSKEVELLMRDVQALRQKRDGVQEVTVSSVHELSAATKSAVAKQVPAGKTIFHYQTDPSVVAGVRVKGLDWQLDSSVDSQLNKLKLAVNQE